MTPILDATSLPRCALKRKAEDSNPEPVTTRLFSKQPARPLAYLPKSPGVDLNHRIFPLSAGCLHQTWPPGIELSMYASTRHQRQLV